MGRANASPLPLPLWSRHTHARASSLSTTPEQHPPPLLRLLSICNLSLSWYGKVLTGTRPSAGHGSGSVCRRCSDQAQQGWQGRGGARAAKKAAPLAGARGAAKFRGRRDSKPTNCLLVSNQHSRDSLRITLTNQGLSLCTKGDS